MSSYFVAGVDEAGRGCLAGPVVAAAVILPDSFDLAGLDDSKKLSASRRFVLEAGIRSVAVGFGLGVIWPAVIDRINILQATFRAMSLAVSRLGFCPDKLMIDGNHTVPFSVLSDIFPVGGNLLQESVVGGDGKVPAIAAASILAKTFRDRLMIKLDGLYPAYGFARHKGYGTKAHISALEEFGPCRIHRLSFARVRPEGDGQELLCLPGI